MKLRSRHKSQERLLAREAAHAADLRANRDEAYARSRKEPGSQNPHKGT